MITFLSNILFMAGVAFMGISILNMILTVFKANVEKVFGKAFVCALLLFYLAWLLR